MKRVVITGMSGVTALGNTYETISKNMLDKKTAIKHMPEWDRFSGLNTRLAGPVPEFKVPEHYTRKQMRSMGRISKLATVATEQSLENAGLLGEKVLSDGSTGIAYGSSTGSTEPVIPFINMFNSGKTTGVTATTYVQMMSHTAAVNVGLFFGLRGRVIPTSSACTSASHAIGYSYEAIKHGYQKIMVAGGGEELCPTEAAVFDTLFATSTKNDTPSETPSPFDKDRDGLVIGEGACTLVLEELEHAQARGAKIHAELIGFGTNCDADHITHPNTHMMETAMRLSLENANLEPEQIGYVSCHATSTEGGDIAESQATSRLFGSSMPVSSMKSFFGHTLGACGSLEAWLAIEMMNQGSFAPTINLNNIDPRCGELDYIQDDWRSINTEYIMSNNFGFGGLNTSLIFKRWNG